MYDERFMRKAINLARENAKEGGQPFGAVLVKDGEIIAKGVNEIHLNNDITAHAELLAVRRANEKLNSPKLNGTVMYASGQPCPMCLSAMHFAEVGEIYFSYSIEQGQPFGLSSSHIYEQIKLPIDEQRINIQHITPNNVKEHPYEVWKRTTE